MHIPGFRQDQDRFRHFAFSPDGNYFLVVASVGDCLIWDRPSGRLVPLPGPCGRGSAAAWEPKAGLLAVGGQDGKLRLLAPPAFEPEEELPAEGDIAVLAFSRDGRYLAWGGPRGPGSGTETRSDTPRRSCRTAGRCATLAFSARRGDAGDIGAGHESQGISGRLGSVPDPLFPPVAHVPAEYGINHGGPDRVAPRFAAARHDVS